MRKIVVTALMGIGIWVCKTVNAQTQKKVETAKTEQTVKKQECTHHHDKACDAKKAGESCKDKAKDAKDCCKDKAKDANAKDCSKDKSKDCKKSDCHKSEKGECKSKHGHKSCEGKGKDKAEAGNCPHAKKHEKATDKQ